MGQLTKEQTRFTEHLLGLMILKLPRKFMVGTTKTLKFQKKFIKYLLKESVKEAKRPTKYGKKP